MSKEETLSNLRENREAYGARVEAVEADLARLRAERLGVYQAQIRTLVLRAYAEGASIAAIQRAYGTRDFRTIKNIIESGEVEVAAHKAKIVEEATPKWFKITRPDTHVYRVDIDGNEFSIVDLEGEEYLILAYNVKDDEAQIQWDGKVLTAESTDMEAQLYEGIREAMNHEG